MQPTHAQASPSTEDGAALTPGAAIADESIWNDYHAVMRCTDGRDPVAATVEQLGSWLREKRIDVSLSHDNDFTDDGRTFGIRYHQRDRGHDVRATLIERTNLGDWRSDVLVSADGWLEVVVRNSQGRFVKVPRLARYLMQALPLGDAGLDFVDHPELWDGSRLDALIGLLTDVHRQAPVFVAALGDEDTLTEAFTARVGLWVKETYGLAKTIVLTQEAALAAANRLGMHAVLPWTVRTFLPGLELGDRWDARRHRYLTTASLAKRPDGRISDLLGSIARGQVQDRPLPPELTRLHRAFQRLEDRQLTRAIQIDSRPRGVVTDDDRGPLATTSKTAAPETDLSEASAGLDLVREILGVDDLTPATLQRIAEAAAAPRIDVRALELMESRLENIRVSLDRREDELDALKRVNQDHEIATALAEDEASSARNEVAWLRRRLSELDDHDNAWSPAPVAHCPADLLALVDELPDGVLFTGDMKDVQEVIERDSLDVCLRVAWDAVLAMGDYLRGRTAGIVASSFHSYVQNTPAGYRGLAPSKSAENETGATKRQFGSERVLPVPKDVSGSGTIQMNAHIKLGRIGMASPRLHYHHDAASERMFIGYLGLHMTNTQTN